MQHPDTSKACRRLTKLAHRHRVSGVVKKAWSSEGGPNNGPTSRFVLRGPRDMELGESRQSAAMVFKGERPG